MMILKLAWKNLWYRPLNTLLGIILLSTSIGIISLLVIVQTSFEEKFRENLKNIDLVLGAKGSPLQLILSAVYQIDAPTGNINFNEASQWAKHSYVDKAIPLAFGDNYKGFRIVGTTGDYLSLLGNGLESGRAFENKYEVVIGKAIARKQGLNLGDTFFGTHGVQSSGHLHDDHPYIVTGIAKSTGKILDHLILCTIESVWAIHHQEPIKATAGKTHSPQDEQHKKDEGIADFTDQKHPEQEHLDRHHHEVSSLDNPENAEKEITAVLIKLKNKIGFITWPRLVAQNTGMQVASPAIEMNRLFSLFGIGISLVHYLAYGIMILSALSIFIALYTRLMRRKQEFAIMRVAGGTRKQVFSIIMYESLFICITGYLAGTIVSRIGLYFLSALTSKEFLLEIHPLSIIWEKELLLIGATLLIGFGAALLPAVKAYRFNISNTLSNE